MSMQCSRMTTPHIIQNFLESWIEDLLFSNESEIKFGSNVLRKTCCILNLRRTKEGILEEFLYNS